MTNTNSINVSGAVSSLNNLSSIWAEFKTSRNWDFKGKEFPQVHIAEGHLLEWCADNAQPIDMFTHVIPVRKCVIESFEDSETGEVYKTIRLDAPKFSAEHAYVKHFRSLAQNCLAEGSVPFIVLGRSFIAGTYTDDKGEVHNAQHFEPMEFYRIEGERLPFTFYDIDGEQLKPYKGLELIKLRKEDKMTLDEALAYMRKLREERSQEEEQTSEES